jgi:hypothetical protein
VSCLALGLLLTKPPSKGLEIGRGWLSPIYVCPLPAALPLAIFAAIEVFTAATVLKPSLERVALLQKVGLTLTHVDAPRWLPVGESAYLMN